MDMRVTIAEQRMHAADTALRMAAMLAESRRGKALAVNSSDSTAPAAASSAATA